MATHSGKYEDLGFGPFVEAIQLVEELLRGSLNFLLPTTTALVPLTTSYPTSSPDAWTDPLDSRTSTEKD